MTIHSTITGGNVVSFRGREQGTSRKGMAADGLKAALSGSTALANGSSAAILRPPAKTSKAGGSDKAGNGSAMGALSETGGGRVQPETLVRSAYGSVLADIAGLQKREGRARLDARLPGVFSREGGEDGVASKATDALAGIVSGKSKPKLRIVDAATLGDAKAAYSAEGGGTIYINENIVSDRALLKRAIAEELGHHVDAKIGGGDAKGDEGALFANLIYPAFNKGERATEAAQRDHGTITVDGKSVEVEFSTIVPKETADIAPYEGTSQAGGVKTWKIGADGNQRRGNDNSIPNPIDLFSDSSLLTLKRGYAFDHVDNLVQRMRSHYNQYDDAQKRLIFAAMEEHGVTFSGRSTAYAYYTGAPWNRVGQTSPGPVTINPSDVGATSLDDFLNKIGSRLDNYDESFWGQDSHHDAASEWTQVMSGYINRRDIRYASLHLEAELPDETALFSNSAAFSGNGLDQFSEFKVSEGTSGASYRATRQFTDKKDGSYNDVSAVISEAFEAAKNDLSALNLSKREQLDLVKQINDAGGVKVQSFTGDEHGPDNEYYYDTTHVLNEDEMKLFTDTQLNTISNTTPLKTYFDQLKSKAQNHVTQSTRAIEGTIWVALTEATLTLPDFRVALKDGYGQIPADLERLDSIPGSLPVYTDTQAALENPQGMALVGALPDVIKSRGELGDAGDALSYRLDPDLEKPENILVTADGRIYYKMDPGNPEHVDGAKLNLIISNTDKSAEYQTTIDITPNRLPTLTASNVARVKVGEGVSGDKVRIATINVNDPDEDLDPETVRITDAGARSVYSRINPALSHGPSQYGKEDFTLETDEKGDLALMLTLSDSKHIPERGFIVELEVEDTGGKYAHLDVGVSNDHQPVFADKDDKTVTLTKAELEYLDADRITDPVTIDLTDSSTATDADSQDTVWYGFEGVSGDYANLRLHESGKPVLSYIGSLEAMEQEPIVIKFKAYSAKSWNPDLPETNQIEKTITIAFENHPPVFADDTPDTIEVNESDVANGVITIGAPFTATDAEDDQVTYWLANDNNVSIRHQPFSDGSRLAIDQATGQLTFEGTLAQLAANASQFTVRAASGNPDGRDGRLKTTDRTVSVTAQNRSPVFAGNTPNEITVKDSDVANGVITIGAPFVATDADGDEVSYWLVTDNGVSGRHYPFPDGSRLSIDQSTGQLTFEGTLAQLAANASQFAVRAVSGNPDGRDGRLKTTDRTVSVTTQDHSPTFGDDTPDNVAVNNDVPSGQRQTLGVFSLAAAEADETILYSLQGTPPAGFSINAATGALVYESTAGQQTPTTPVRLTIQASDGATATTHEVTVNFVSLTTNVGKASSTDIDLTAFVPSGGTTALQGATLEGADSDKFEIQGTILKAKSGTPSSSDPARYDVKVKIENDGKVTVLNPTIYSGNSIAFENDRPETSRSASAFVDTDADLPSNAVSAGYEGVLIGNGFKAFDPGNSSTAITYTFETVDGSGSRTSSTDFRIDANGNLYYTGAAKIADTVKSIRVTAHGADASGTSRGQAIRDVTLNRGAEITFAARSDSSFVFDYGQALKTAGTDGITSYKISGDNADDFGITDKGVLIGTPSFTPPGAPYTLVVTASKPDGTEYSTRILLTQTENGRAVRTPPAALNEIGSASAAKNADRSTQALFFAYGQPKLTTAAKTNNNLRVYDFADGSKVEVQAHQITSDSAGTGYQQAYTSTFYDGEGKSLGVQRFSGAITGSSDELSKQHLAFRTNNVSWSSGHPSGTYTPALASSQSPDGSIRDSVSTLAKVASAAIPASDKATVADAGAANVEVQRRFFNKGTSVPANINVRKYTLDDGGYVLTSAHQLVQSSNSAATQGYTQQYFNANGRLVSTRYFSGDLQLSKTPEQWLVQPHLADGSQAGISWNASSDAITTPALANYELPGGQVLETLRPVAPLELSSIGTAAEAQSTTEETHALFFKYGRAIDNNPNNRRYTFADGSSVEIHAHRIAPGGPGNSFASAAQVYTVQFYDIAGEKSGSASTLLGLKTAAADDTNDANPPLFHFADQGTNLAWYTADQYSVQLLPQWVDELLRPRNTGPLVLPPLLAANQKPDGDEVRTGPKTAKDYFLTPDELTNIRGGSARNTNIGDSQYANLTPQEIAAGKTAAVNNVNMTVNGQDHFKSLYQDIEKLGDGDYLWANAYFMDQDAVLDPTASDPQHTTLENTLIRAIRRGVKVRLLVRSNFDSPPQARLNQYEKINAAATDEAVKRGWIDSGEKYYAILPDERANTSWGNLHSKVWIIGSGKPVDEGGFVSKAYVGGGDIWKRGWDNKAHNQGEYIRPDGSMAYLRDVVGGGKRQGFQGQTETNFQLEGDIAEDFARNLWLQITNPTPPSPGLTFPATAWPGFTKPTEARDGKIDMQAVFNAGPEGAAQGYYPNWAPSGELSYLNAAIKAISKADDSIVVSDQYLWYKPFMDAIAARLRQKPGLQVLLLTNPSEGMRWDDLGPLRNSPVFARETVASVAWHNLQEFHKARDHDPNQSRVYAFTLKKEGTEANGANDGSNMIYNHQKLLLVDDEYLLGGSMSIEPTGATNDVDAGFSMFSREKVPEFRKKFFAEMLNLDEDDQRLKTLDSSIETAVDFANQGDKRVANWWPGESVESAPYVGSLNWRFYANLIYRVFEPEGVIHQTPGRESYPVEIWYPNVPADPATIQNMRGWYSTLFDPTIVVGLREAARWDALWRLQPPESQPTGDGAPQS